MNYEENLRIQIAANIKSIFQEIDGINIIDGFHNFYNVVLPKIDEYISSYPIDFERYEPFYISQIKHSVKPILERIWEIPTENRHKIEEDFGNIGRKVYLDYEKANKIKVKEFLIKMASAYDQVNIETAQEHAAKNQKEGCFIATKVYGTYDHPKVLELRTFRDTSLKKYNLGKKFIKIYYQYSPKISQRMNNYKFNWIIRGVLNLFIKTLKITKVIR